MTVISEHTGWLFDLYAHPQKGVVLWLLGENGRPHSFQHELTSTFHAGGASARLKELGLFLRSRYSRVLVKFERITRPDLYDGPQELMSVHVSSPAIFARLFREASRRFDDLVYYDADIPLTLRYAAAYDVFLMAHCKLTAGPDGKVTGIKTFDTPWDLEPRLPPVRRLSLRPDVDPSHAPPKHLLVRFNDFFLRLPLDQPYELLNLLNSILSAYDPDVIQTHYGDTWLFTHLLETAQRIGVPFNPNRDTSLPVVRRKEVSFFNYGRAHYRGPQVHLRGRWHVDTQNCMTYNQYQLLGAIDQTRMSSLPLQEVARRSPGASIAAMQCLTAMRRGVLIPYQNQKGEIPKTYSQLVQGDRGGLVYQPLAGLFRNAAVLDFSSLMPSIMIEYNVSPDTVGPRDQSGGEVEQGALDIPELGVKISPRLGLMSETLRPVRDKRLTLKRMLKALAKDDPRHAAIHRRYKPVVDALKWLTVVAYGRLGYANSTFGRINAHEVVSFIARKVILEAKAIAEDRGFTVLHLYVDSIFVSRPDAAPEDFQALASEIEHLTRLPMDVENVYHWFAFLGSRQHPSVTVANRFFGLGADGEFKIRGIALRRGDTPAFISGTQLQVLNVFGREADPEKLVNLLPEVLQLMQTQLRLLKDRQVPLKDLVVTHTLSREPEEYSVLSASAIAVRQLQALGKTMKMGMQVRFIYTGPGPGVFAWDSPAQLDPRHVDVPRYKELFLRAMAEVLQPLGVTENLLREWLFHREGKITAQDVLSLSAGRTRLEMPLFWELPRLRADVI
jgi:DNA polymerase-2